MNFIRDSPDNQKIRQNDTCVIYISESLKYILKIEADAKLQTKFGVVRATELLGHPYGARFDLKKGWILPLRLTPELWTQLLPHRTQILYQADISMILLQLDIKPGAVVVESGTGSGSLSHSILRACLPNGFLYTFDINESRVRDAQAEFNEHGFQENVLVTNRNVCELGFGPELEGKADACMLDLPQTWLAIEHAHKVLKADGSRLCTFSPCVEQVQQNVTKLRELKFKDIITLECLIRPYEYRTTQLREWSDDVLEGLAAVERRRFENLKSSLNPSKRSKLDPEPAQPACPSTSLETTATATTTTPTPQVTITIDSLKEDELGPLNHALNDPKAPFHPSMLPKRTIAHARQVHETASHSGFLTFASKRR